MDGFKGTRKDTPAHVQETHKLHQKLAKTSLKPTSEDDEDAILSLENKETSETTSKRFRKPTPAHVKKNLGKNKKAFSMDEGILEMEEEEVNVTHLSSNSTKKEPEVVGNTSRIYRKDTPATIETQQFKACSWSSNSIEEEDDDDVPDLEAGNTLKCYRLRKQSFLLCSHPSLEK